MKKLFLLTMALATLNVAHAQNRRAIAINVAPAQVPALAKALQTAALPLQGGSLSGLDGATGAVVLEANDNLSAQDAQKLGEWVRRGGALLLSTSKIPGNALLRLAFLSPTTGWHTQLRTASRGSVEGAIESASGDAQWFPTGAPQVALPFHFAVRPFDAAERGEGRYERFARTIRYIDVAQNPGDTFWTRPLLNRDWRVRLRGNDAAQAPLLLSGRYGAGRVVVWGSSLADADKAPNAAALWSPIVKWLAQEAPVAAKETKAPDLSPAFQLDKAARALRVTLKNPTPNPLSLQVVARLATWERALIGDVLRDVTLAANASATVELPLPAPSATNYQALDFRDAFDARVGVLSGDGAQLWREDRLPLDLRPDVRLEVSTDNLRAVPYPFDAPGYGAQDRAFPNRLGAPVMAYAYAPSAKIEVSLALSNGLRNLAPLAVVQDETSPQNASVMALNDGAAHGEKGPIDGITAFGTWNGTADRENVLSWKFPAPVRVAEVVLNGAPDNYRNYLDHNPGAARVEIDGREVARAEDLDARFPSENGRVHLRFAPVMTQEIVLRLPWVNKVNKIASGRNRTAPWLGEVEILGAMEAPAPARGVVSLDLVEAATGTRTAIAKREITLDVQGSQQLQFPLQIPAGAKEPRFYRIEARFGEQVQSVPLLSLQPARPLQSVFDARPTSAPELGFIVTRGFRNVFETGTGTGELSGGWASPDDLIWAYAHGMKQLNAQARTQANRLYLSENDFRHYSTPWRALPSGEEFYDVATPLLVERMKRDRRWKDSDTAVLSHSDRWDTGPSVDSSNSWQDFIAFDQWLRAQKLPALQGRTRGELASEIQQKHGNRWQAWHLERYIRNVHQLRDAFGAEGKKLLITAQGTPFVPPRYEAELTSLIRGQSDDSTWGMEDESIPFTTGRQMGIKAFNPGWKLSTLFNWGWDSAILNNPHWHNPVSTTEPSRRHIYDRAFRGTIANDGRYESIHTYGYGMNGGVSYTMTPNDWQQSWRAQERHSLLTPDGPLGAGLIVATDWLNDPQRTVFSGGGMGGSEADAQIKTVANAVRQMQDAGIGVSFAANARALAKWSGTAPLIALDVARFSDEEIAVLRRARDKGATIAAFAGEGALSPAARALFGDLKAQNAIAGKNTLLIAGRAGALESSQARALAPQLQATLRLPIVFPAGTSGYGFTSGNRRFIVLEDWREEGRIVTLRLRASAGATSASAVDVNDHRALSVRREGEFWLIETPLRPGDGALISVEEVQP